MRRWGRRVRALCGRVFGVVVVFLGRSRVGVFLSSLVVSILFRVLRSRRIFLLVSGSGL